MTYVAITITALVFISLIIITKGIIEGRKETKYSERRRRERKAYEDTIDSLI